MKQETTESQVIYIPINQIGGGRDRWQASSTPGSPLRYEPSVPEACQRGSIGATMLLPTHHH